MPGIMISGNNAKIGTDELLSIINQARLEHGEKPVRNNDFIPRVKDELEGEHYETFVVQNSNGTKSENLVVSNDQAVLIGMRESKAVRRTVLTKLKEKEPPLLPQTLPEALRLAADLAEEKIQLESQLAIAARKHNSWIATSMHLDLSASARPANYSTSKKTPSVSSCSKVKSCTCLQAS